MLIGFAGNYGDISLLNELKDQGLLDPLAVTEVENWNYLHKSNLLNPSPVETIRFYIDQGVDVNAQDCYGMTPLHYAMRERNGNAAMALLEAGANPNTPNVDNLIPLSMIGGMPDRLDVLEKMLECGGNVHFFNGNETVLESYLPSDNEPEIKPIYELMKKYS